MPRPVLSAVLLGVSLALTACGEGPVTSGEPAENTYEGDLYVARADALHAKAGAAGDVVDCTTWGAGGFQDRVPYDQGATADGADEALEVARSEWGFGGVQSDLLVARTEPDRVLYVVEVEGVTKQAVIVHDGPAVEGTGGDGWYVESWAHCDVAELPASYAEDIGLLTWTEGDTPVPTTVIAGYTGPEHCDWQSMTFLYVDGARNAYVRDPQPGLDEFFRASYTEHTDLPADAVDTGYEHGGDHLWLSADAQLAYVGSTNDAEVWPRTKRPLECA